MDFLNETQPAVESQAVSGHLWNKYTWASSPQFCEPSAVSCRRREMWDLWLWNLRCRSCTIHCKSHPSKQQVTRTDSTVSSDGFLSLTWAGQASTGKDRVALGQKRAVQRREESFSGLWGMRRQKEWVRWLWLEYDNCQFFYLVCICITWQNVETLVSLMSRWQCNIICT